MKSMQSQIMIMQELESIKTLLIQQNKFLKTLGFEASKEIASAAEVTYNEKSPVKAKQSENLEYRISSLLQELMVPVHLSGYHYLCEAIKLCFQDIEYIDGITKRLYPDIAYMFRTTWSRAERNIRNAIDVSYSRAIKYPFYKNFPHAKPTNSEFIAMCVEKLKFE